MFISFITLFTVVSYFYLNVLKKNKEGHFYIKRISCELWNISYSSLSKGQKMLITLPESIQSVQSHVDSLEMLPY